MRATIEVLLTKDELFSIELIDNNYNLEKEIINLQVLELYKISLKLLPLIYPNGIITDNTIILNAGISFLWNRAIQLNVPIF